METRHQQTIVVQNSVEEDVSASHGITPPSLSPAQPPRSENVGVQPFDFSEKARSSFAEIELDRRVRMRTAELDKINQALRIEILEQRRIEAELRASETRWYSMFAHAAVGLAELSLQGKFERVNDTFCRLLGRSRSAFIGSSIVTIIHPDDLNQSMVLFRLVTTSGEPKFVDHRYLRPDGATLLVNSQIARTEDSDGKPQAILIAVTDITDRKNTEMALHRSEAEFRAFFELAAVGIGQVDARKKLFLRVNRRFAEMTGYNEFELRQMSFACLVPAHENQTKLDLFAQLLAGEANEYSDEKQLRHKKGHLIWVNVAASLIRDAKHNPLRSVMVVQDITERKAAEAALTRAREQLELRVQERTAELDQVNRTLMAEIISRKKIEEERQSVLRQLVSVQEEERRRISRELHDDIGQHLTALMLGLKAIDSRNDFLTTKNQLEKLQEITTIVGKEVHDLALELRPTALDDLGLARMLSNYLEEWATRAGLEVDFHPVGFDRQHRLPSPVETTLYRIVQEALNNVLKHAKAKGVSVIIERRNNYASAIIEDDGCGFDSESLKARGSDQRLGLLGMHERAALVGGELRIESSPGHGTTVFVQIPLHSIIPK